MICEMEYRDCVLSDDDSMIKPREFIPPIIPRQESMLDCKVIDKEMVNHPEHYNGDSEYECIKVLRAWMTKDEYKGFLKGNALKYLCRVGKKDDVSQELKKAKWYLDKLVEEIEGND